MNLKIQFILMCLAVIGLAACATTPQQRYAGRIKAAQASGQPLLVYKISGAFQADESRPTNSDRAESQSYWLKVGFINTDRQPIRELVFKVGAENLATGKSLLGPNGAPLQAKLTAKGPFAPGTNYIVAGGHSAATWPVAAAALLAQGDACVRLDGIEVTYQDHTALTVAPQQADDYLVPQMRLGIRCAYFLWYRGVPSPGFSPIYVSPPASGSSS